MDGLKIVSWIGWACAVIIVTTLIVSILFAERAGAVSARPSTCERGTCAVSYLERVDRCDDYCWCHGDCFKWKWR